MRGYIYLGVVATTTIYIYSLIMLFKTTVSLLAVAVAPAYANTARPVNSTPYSNSTCRRTTVAVL
jgi:hypothetical protein